MATPKKKHLIELMIEAGVKWPDGAEYAAQDKRDLKVNFYSNGEPDAAGGRRYEWMVNNCHFLEEEEGILLPSLCREWDQTIVTREQYAEAVAAANTSGETNQVRESEDVPASQPADQYCASVMRQMPDNTIEQLTADYHAKAAEADRLQAVADEALKAADDALIALEKAGKLIRLVISVDTVQKLPVQSEITDWRDLRIGDVIECVTQGNYGYRLERLNWVVGEECQVVKLEEPGRAGQPILAKFKNGEEWWIGEFKFIRRP